MKTGRASHLKDFKQKKKLIISKINFWLTKLAKSITLFHMLKALEFDKKPTQSIQHDIPKKKAQTDLKFLAPSNNIIAIQRRTQITQVSD